MDARRRVEGIAHRGVGVGGRGVGQVVQRQDDVVVSHADAAVRAGACDHRSILLALRRKPQCGLDIQHGRDSMQQIHCAGCGLAAPSYDIVNFSSIDTGYIQLCGRCFNMRVARLAGLTDFEHVRFEPIGMTDVSGEHHDFHFRAHLFGSGVALEAFELRDAQPGGYEFQVIGEPEDDLLALLGRLIEKMRRALAVQHVEGGAHGLQITDRMIVRGRIDCDPDADDRMPAVVIDGREISWADFGRMLMTFEGFQFKMEIRDRSDEV